MRNKGVRAARPAPAQGSTHRRAGARGPWGLGPDRGTRPRPASAGSLETGTRRPWPRARGDPGSGRTPAAHGADAQHPGVSRTPDSGPGAGGREEGAPRRPPRGAAGAGAALTQLCAARSSARRARAPAAAARAASAASGQAGGRTRGLGAASPAPGPRSSPAPRPGHARWPTQASEPGGAVPAGQRVERAREGRPSPPRLRGSWAPRGIGLGSHFTDGETEWRRGCPFAALPVESGARCLRSHSVQPREHPLHVSPRRKLGLREGKPLVRGHSAPGWGPGSVRSPSSHCADICRLRLGRTSGLSLPAPALLSRRCPRPREWSRHEWGVGGKRLGFPRLPPP